METNLTLPTIAALSGVMLVGASIPSVSVLAVSARSAAFGFTHGIFTSLGIVVGDIVFILIAIYGLSVLAGLMGSYFVVIKYLGGAYLVWLGIVLWRSESKTEAVEGNRESSVLASFMAGLLITLGDQKAILFYLGFLPAFVDISTLSFADAGIIIGIATVAVGGPKLVYAYLANRAGQILKSPRATKAINTAAGGVMVGVGALLLVKA
jgi:threonine/homoserine/homoserine lactone efflux protein